MTSPDKASKPSAQDPKSNDNPTVVGAKDNVAAVAAKGPGTSTAVAGQKIRPTTGRKPLGAKEVIPFAWKLIGDASDAVLTLFKAVERDEVEAHLQRVQKEGYYKNLQILDVDAKVAQPKPPPAPKKASRRAKKTTKTAKKVAAKTSAKTVKKATAKAVAKTAKKATVKAAAKPVRKATSTRKASSTSSQKAPAKKSATKSATKAKKKKVTSKPATKRSAKKKS